MPEIPVPNLDAKPAASSPATVAEPSPTFVPVPDAPPASSTEPTVKPDVPAASSPAPDAPPVSSTEPKDPKETLLKAVQKVVEPKVPDAKTADTSQGQTTQAQAADGTKTPDPKAPPTELTPEELKTYSPNAQSRIKTLITERNDLNSQIKEIEPFRSYMRENDLSTDDLAFSLQALATLRKGDYDGFLSQVQPFMQIALEATGRALPADLQEQVRLGRVAPDVAVNMTKQRVELGNAQATIARNAEVDQQRQEEGSREARRSAVAQWEQTIKVSDPDYARKLDIAKAYVAGIRAERGDPNSPEEAVSIAQDAYERATQALKAALPARTPTSMSPSGIRQSSNPSATPVPNTLLEAAMQGLNRARQRAS